MSRKKTSEDTWTGGEKFDTAKPDMSLLDPYAMEQVSAVMTFGAAKYAAFNWTRGIRYRRLIAAALRHVFAFMRGEDNDPESGLSHIAHAVCCLMMLLGMMARHPEMDDREHVSEPDVVEQAKART